MSLFLSLLIYIVFGIGGLFALLKAKKFKTNNNIGKFFLCSGISLLLFVMSILSFDFYASFVGDIYYPSIANYFYLMFVISIFFSLFYLLKVFHINITKKSAIFWGVLTLVVVVISSLSLTFDVKDTIEKTVFTNTVNILYLLADIFSITTAIIFLFFYRKKFHDGAGVFISGFFVYVISLLIFFILSPQSHTSLSYITDTLYLLFGGLMVAGIYIISKKFRLAII